MQKWNEKKRPPSPTKLEGWVKRIRNSYGKTMVPEEVMDFISTKIINIPEEAWGWIESEFPRFYLKCPEVLHVAIVDMWHRWRRENPEKCSEYPNEIQECRNANCHYGWMIFWKREPMWGKVAEIPDGSMEGMLHEFAVNCADCRRSRNQVAPAYSFETCIKKGWVPDSFEIKKQSLEETEEMRLQRYTEYVLRGKHKLREQMEE